MQQTFSLSLSLSLSFLFSHNFFLFKFQTFVFIFFFFDQPIIFVFQKWTFAKNVQKKFLLKLIFFNVSTSFHIFLQFSHIKYEFSTNSPTSFNDFYIFQRLSIFTIHIKKFGKVRENIYIFLILPLPNFNDFT